MNFSVDSSMFTSGPAQEPFAVGVNGAGYPNGDTLAWATRQVEKIRAAVVGGLRFLPRLDNYTEETSEIRAAYRLMLREPVLKSSHKSKVESVAQLPWNVTPVSDSDRDVEIAEFVGHCGKRVKGGTCGIAKAIAEGALLDGFSVSNVVSMRETRGRFAGKDIWRLMKPKDTEFLTLSTDQFRNIIAVRPLAFGIGESYPPESFVIYSYGSLFCSPLGTSDHRAAYGSFWFKDTIKKLWGLHLDKYVSPMLKGTYSTSDQKAALEIALEQARANTWMTIPTGVMIEAVQLATRGPAEFEAACRYQDEQMLIATEGGSLHRLQGQVADGRGDTSVHKAGQTAGEWGLSSDVQQVINEQMIPQLIERNYAGAEYPEVTLGSVSEEEMASTLNLWKGLQGLGYRLSRGKASKLFGVEEATDQADLLAPAGQPLSAVQPLPVGQDAQAPPPAPPAPKGGAALGAVPFR